MADAYQAAKTRISQQLFGRDIPIEQLTDAQRAEVQKALSNDYTYSAVGFDDKFAAEAKAAGPGPAPTQSSPFATRGTTPGSVARADAVGKIGTRAIADSQASGRELANLQGANDLANLTDQNAIRSLSAADEQKRLAQTDIARRVRSDADTANAATGNLLGGYTQAQAGFNTQDQQNLDRYMGETAPLMTRMTARGSAPADLQRQVDSYGLAQNIAGGSLDYSASQYASNPADIQRQMASYNDLQGVGNGSLDYSAAQWQSNPGDVARQLQGYNDLRSIGQGSLDWNSQAAMAYAGKEEQAQQRKALYDIQDDLETGSAGQKEVRDKFKALSDPEVTAKERFLSELARRDFESQDQSSRLAQSRNASMRGMRSGALDIATTQATRQGLAQDRLLKELGIQAGAVDRSMQALGGWGTAENSIRQGDQNALNMQAGLTTDMRNASFDEAYKRGIGADNASAANQATRLTGTVQSANQATNIRNASDAVGMFNTGETNTARANNQSTRLSGKQSAAQQSNAIRSANDYVGTFNVGEQNTAKANNQTTRMNGAQLQAVQSNAIRSANDSQRQFEDNFASNEAQRVGNLSTDRANVGLRTTAQQGGRVTDTFDRGITAIDSGYNRSQDANGAEWDAATGAYQGSKDYFDAVTGAGDRRVGRASDAAVTGSNVRSATSTDLARALGVNVDQYAINEERDRAGL